VVVVPVELDQLALEAGTDSPEDLLQPGQVLGANTLPRYVVTNTTCAWSR